MTYGDIFIWLFDLILEYSNIAQVQEIFEYRILFISIEVAAADVEKTDEKNHQKKYLSINLA